MSLSLPDGYRWDPSLQQGPETAALTARLWPAYLVAESDLPEPGWKFAISADEFARRFPVWGVRRESDGALVAYANGVLLAVDLRASRLPDAGWRFAIQNAGSNEPRNCLCLLVANVDPAARGLGLSQILIARAKLAARDLGFDTMIAPVRPTLKHEHPFETMEAYVERCSEADGSAHFDPWIQMHRKSGGEIQNICRESVIIRATLPLWRQWTGLKLETSGDQLLPQGLAPLKVDTYRNLGTYTEPNVWMRYEGTRLS